MVIEPIRRLFMSPYRSIFAPGLHARPGGADHRRRLGDRPLHRARARGARRRGRDRRPQGRQARRGPGRDRGRRRRLLDPCVRHPRRGAGAVDGRGRARAPRPHRRARQQRRRPVPRAAVGDQRQGLGRGRAQQPDRRLPVRARMRQPVDAEGADGARAAEAERRRDRQHHRRHVGRHAGHGPLGRGARRHAQLHRDGGARVGAGARQRRRAGLDRVERHGPLPARDGGDGCAA